jgi:hypothetical protein
LYEKNPPMWKEKSRDLIQLNLSIINKNELISVFSRTISRDYHHIKNTYINGWKHKFTTSRMNSNKNKEISYQVGMSNQATEGEI